jgi:RNA polymerase sigma-70 factor (ECF subfamily)
MDAQEFKQRVFPSRDRLYRMARLLLGSREEAEDALQDVLLRLWDNRLQLSAYQSVEALAVRITRNLCLDRLKYRHNKKMVAVEKLTAAADSRTPEQLAELSDSTRLMQRLYAELPEAQRVVLHLREVEEYSYEEIEQVTGMNVNNIRVILSRARKQVRENYLKINAYERK